MKKALAYIFVLVTLVAGTASYVYLINENIAEKENEAGVSQNTINLLGADKIPEFKQLTLIDTLTRPWDVAVSPGGTVFFTEKGGTISKLNDGKRQVLEAPLDVKVEGEAGMMGLTLDSEYDNNRYLYACFASSNDSKPDVRVVRWTVDSSENSLTDRKDIITGIPYNDSTYPGRHSGCRVRMGHDGSLWVGTGDAAIGSNPQATKSLGGKILLVDRDGDPVRAGLGEDFDPRIYSYGHRNVQGIALIPDTDGDIPGFNAEHGSSIDDEVNQLLNGNFGWDPKPGYTESGTPMTDLQKFPDAIEPVWSSGNSTIAVSGATYVNSEKWGLLNNSLLLAAQKDQHVRALILNDTRDIVEQEFELISNQGRIRSVVQAPDGDIYITTDNGGGKDKIILLTVN